MKASDIFTKEEISFVKWVRDLFKGDIVRVFDLKEEKAKIKRKGSSITMKKLKRNT